MAAEELGADGAYFRVHHFARQLASPFPLLAAIGARTSRIEIGTGVIDMRYENPLYMAEDAGAADLITGGGSSSASAADRRSRSSTAPLLRLQPAGGHDDADMARQHTAGVPRGHLGRGFAAQPAADVPEPARAAPLEPHAPGCATASVGRRHTGDRRVGGRQGMNLMSSTLIVEDTGVPFHELQAEQIERFREAWAEAGRNANHASRSAAASCRWSATRTVPIRTRARRPTRSASSTVGALRQHLRGEPDMLVDELAKDEAIAAADTILLTVPNQLGIDYNAHLIDTVLPHVAPELGWR